MTPVKAEFDDLSLQEAKDDTGKPAKRDSQKLAEVQLEVPGGEPKKDKEAKKEARRSKEGTSVSVGNLTQSDPPKPTIDIQEASSSQKKPETKLPEVVYYFVLLCRFDSFAQRVLFVLTSFTFSRPPRCQQTPCRESSRQRSRGRFHFVTWLGKGLPASSSPPILYNEQFSIIAPQHVQGVHESLSVTRQLHQKTE